MGCVVLNSLFFSTAFDSPGSTCKANLKGFNVHFDCWRDLILKKIRRGLFDEVARACP